VLDNWKRNVLDQFQLSSAWETPVVRQVPLIIVDVLLTQDYALILGPVMYDRWLSDLVVTDHVRKTVRCVEGILGDKQRLHEIRSKPSVTKVPHRCVLDGLLIDRNVKCLAWEVTSPVRSYLSLAEQGFMFLAKQVFLH
jgi:hypothetical protein